jgi:hypothetical protein
VVMTLAALVGTKLGTGINRNPDPLSRPTVSTRAN